MTIDKTTLLWIRNKADELAAADGHRFDLEPAAWAVWWIEYYCRLYEGELAGEPLYLRGCHECDSDADREELLDWDEGGREQTLDRLDRHAACYAAGHTLDWQLDVTARMFGWLRHSEKWRREIRRFRQASVWVAKKNKKSPTLAAWGLYLLCGDGEPGQKIYLGAKDGKQAKSIAGKHAVEMVQSSPMLSSVCTCNKMAAEITHEPSRSVMIPLSSSNSASQKSKEGLNGSCCIDETHVVDDEFIGRISRAGISRSEPLQIETSTAGDDPDGYGFRRFQYAQSVAAGETLNHQLLPAIYAAPQDATDEDIMADPLHFARQANPALGHTVDPEELLNDATQSKANSVEWNRFKKYRLNIWTGSLTKWLRPSDWTACYEPFTAEQFRGQLCYAGLDLSKTRDLTALTLIFPGDDDIWRQINYYWMPREAAIELAEIVPYLDWEEQGAVELTDGPVVDYAFVKSRILEVEETYDLQVLAYDPWNAETLTQELETEGVHRVAMQQTIANLAEPTAEYERRILNGTLRHNGNPLTTWQAGHVQVKCDHNKNMRPVKRQHGDHRTIDGIVAGVIAAGQLLVDPPATGIGLFA